MSIFLIVLIAIVTALVLGSFYVWYLVRHSRNSTRKRKMVRTLAVMGSGGHTTEMCCVLENLSSAYKEFSLVIADTDQISQGKVEELAKFKENSRIEWIPRSREVGQSYITSVFTTLRAFYYSLAVVWRFSPDLVLTNGPGTCIPICVAAALFDIFRLRDTTIVFVESICRVQSLSLTGAILYFSGLADDEVRYEFRQVKKEDDNLEKLHRDLEKKGIQFKPKSVEEIYKEVAAEDTDNWANIRGPHENEDNSEYFKIQAAHPLDPQAQVADQQALAGLVELGFDEWTANLALLRTGNAGIETAVTWIVERSNDSDFDSGSSDDEDEADEGREQPAGMGASQSTGEGAGPSNAVGFDVIKALAKNARTHKMVFVANMSLKMGAGKLAAQVGHACLAVYQKAVSTEEGRAGIQSWERMGAVKVVLKGESTEQLMELLKQAKEVGCSAYLVADAGYTQIPAGSRTVLGVFGPKEAVDSVCGQLKLL
ncbi:unnamed protein product, partial [Mesorhabditis spiculigera]